ncbi:MAG: 1,4-dihydroxy-2-naphthoate polyprenyltransferase [Acidimicrobiia bacterium]|nr:1,4-dihydroxy-2-naphthoate polyprenyltransferase [Acidimicrobiia bacterium]
MGRTRRAHRRGRSAPGQQPGSGFSARSAPTGVTRPPSVPNSAQEASAPGSFPLSRWARQTPRVTTGTSSGRRGASGGAEPGPVRRWVLGARPRTLPAAVVPVAVGIACAVGEGHGLSAWRMVAALVVSLALQVATNYANDYSDGVRGTDSAGRVGPLRLVASGLASPRHVKLAALAAFGVAGLAGLALAVVVGWELLLVGAACMAAGWFYTGGPRPYGYAGLGELFVFAFFGLVATAGTTYVLVERVTGLAVAAAVPVGFLVTAILVVNNLRDIPTDAATGKRTLAVRLGDRRTRGLYVALVTATFVAVPIVAGLGERPLGALSLAALVIARRPVTVVLSGAKGPALIPVLGGTGRLHLVFGLLFAFGVLVSGALGN